MLIVSQELMENNRWRWRLRFGNASVQLDRRRWFLVFSEGEATAFDADLANENDFKFFKCQAKLLGNTVADGNNTFLKTVTIALPFKYLNHSKYHWLSWIEA